MARRCPCGRLVPPYFAKRRLYICARCHYQRYKAAWRKYYQSAHGKAATRRYAATAKAKARRQKYDASPKGKARHVKHEIRRIRVGEQSVGLAKTVTQAKRIRRHIRQRLQEFQCR